jgi:AcrR family transcriptional regulator
MQVEITTETERKIVEAATKIFLEKGKDGARMEEIAKEANLNKALLHYYFRSKNKLYQYVFKKIILKNFHSIFDSIAPIDDFKLFLKNFIYKYIEQIQKNPQVVRFILWEISKGGTSLKEIFAEISQIRGENIPQLVLKKLNYAIKDKKIRKIDPQQLVLSVIGMSIYVFIARPIIEAVFEDLNVLDDHFLERRKEAVFDLVWNGIKLS